MEGEKSRGIEHADMTHSTPGPRPSITIQYNGVESVANMLLRQRALRVTTALAVAVALTAGVPAVAFAGSADGDIRLSALDLSPATVDASTGSATANLTWTITDSNASASTVQGTVEIRQRAADGEFTGPAYDVPFGLTQTATGDVSANYPATAQSSSYSYTFQVPQYVAGTAAVWAVERVTASDDQSDSLDAGSATLNRFASSVTATELQDASVPKIANVSFDNADQPTYLYDVGVSPTVGYLIEVTSADAGFWHGELHLRNTAGRTLDAAFSLQYGFDGSTSCGNGPDAGVNWGASDVMCDVVVSIPAGSPAGTWTLDSVQLTDTAGAKAKYSHLGELPVQVTDDSKLQAGDFSLNPTSVNNWSSVQKIALSLTPTGATGGISTVVVDTNPGCGGSTTQSPAVSADGSLTVSISMPPIYQKQCSVTGIAVVDGAGDVAVYGSTFDGPALNLVANQIPDTSAPVALSASLSSPTTTSTQGELLSVDVSSFAGVGEMDVEVYDSTTGTSAYYQYGGVTWTTSGTLKWGINLSGVAPGTYTVAFTLIDNGGLSTAYGYAPSASSNSQPMPGGPLQFTVAAS
ncbi:hypothetical protein KDK95_13130 [Actinospica sp. MGRD01-02]|uniref:Uncharacterized protein n=1 Tax=Actinospica acidithermotolerans TaxID=2828514 RepID=A0A941EGJ8_9ACTN|nr:hypothetical protein [Actinospica acidithermotolerans]MBR7827254.1 hypothetical protein [Actinospica acidithermotolerans]